LGSGRHLVFETVGLVVRVCWNCKQNYPKKAFQFFFFATDFWLTKQSKKEGVFISIK
jgi:hypothetical protein